MINRVFILSSEQEDGYNRVNGRPHGIKWKRIWTVNVECGTEEQAKLIKEDFYRKIEKENRLRQ